jgi:Glycoside-hydrolase family GH114
MISVSLARRRARFARATPCFVWLLALGACSDTDSSVRDAAQTSDTPENETPDAALGTDDPDAASLDDAGADVRMPTDAGRESPDASASDAGVRLPPLNAGLDYQLGGAYTPPTGVGIVSRDRNEKPAVGLYNICYVNGFQAQPDEKDFWLQQHPDLVLRDQAGKPVIDPDWDEMLLDVSSADKRTRLAQIEADWIAGCAEHGFDAVEVDNLDSYARSGGRIREADAVAFMALLSGHAHDHGLAIAQKNSAEIVGQRKQMGTDFAVSEECMHYKECDTYVGAYGRNVLIIEYVRADFDAACKSYPNYAIVLRDHELVSKGSAGYVYDGC